MSQNLQDLQPGFNDLAPFFLAENEQDPQEVARMLAQFINGADQTLDFAVYDLRLNEKLKAIVAEALKARATAGVAIRIAYDADKPQSPNYEVGMDPAPAGTGQFVQSLGYPWKRISGMKLMHNKYIVRDGGTAKAAVWTGSTNLTDDAWTLQENNILRIVSSELAAFYNQDFTDLWEHGIIENTGAFDTRTVDLHYNGQPAKVRVLFSPGRGPAIDYEVAHRIAQARSRIRICSMLLNSSAFLAALSDQLKAGRVPVDGIYDRTQMESVIQQWQDVPHNRWKIGALADIVDYSHLAGKNSTPYTPTSIHDFMHNKMLVIDDVVITGSYNFSHSAEMNAENILMIQNSQLADRYSQYIDHLIQKYGGQQ